MTSNTEGLKSLGESKTIYSDQYDKNLLETFENPQQHTPFEIEIEAPEMTCLCPKTGQPDFATIRVLYSPNKKCVESKSFKLYLFSFRNTGAFHEDVTNRIAEDLYNLLEPHWVQVKGEFAPRGGIKFHPTVMLKSPEFKESEQDGFKIQVIDTSKGLPDFINPISIGGEEN